MYCWIFCTKQHSFRLSEYSFCFRKCSSVNIFKLRHRSFYNPKCLSVCLSVRGKNFYMKEMYFASHTFQVSLTHKCKIILILAHVYFPPFLVSIPSWCVFPICLKSILQSPASCCQSCVLATTEHKYVQLLASLRRMVDCTLYHVIFNSSPNRKLNYHHVCT